MLEADQQRRQSAQTVEMNQTMLHSNDPKSRLPNLFLFRLQPLHRGPRVHNATETLKTENLKS